jgi:hypothetical protein
MLAHTLHPANIHQEIEAARGGVKVIRVPFT